MSIDKNYRYKKKRETTELYFYREYVEKKNFENGKSEREFYNLLELKKNFPDTKYGEWIFRVVKPVYYDWKRDSFWMEKIEGEQLTGKKLSKEPLLAEKAGIWLGLFQNANLHDNTKVKRFGDFKFSHVFVNKEKKEVVLIDPGGGFGGQYLIEYELISFILGMINAGFKTLSTNYAAIQKFLNGYKQAFKFEYDFESREVYITHTIKEKLKKYRKIRLKKQKNIIKKVIYILFYPYLHFYMKIVVPRAFKKTFNN